MILFCGNLQKAEAACEILDIPYSKWKPDNNYEVNQVCLGNLFAYNEKGEMFKVFKDYVFLQNVRVFVYFEGIELNKNTRELLKKEMEYIIFLGKYLGKKYLVQREENDLFYLEKLL